MFYPFNLVRLESWLFEEGHVTGDDASACLLDDIQAFHLKNLEYNSKLLFRDALIKATMIHLSAEGINYGKANCHFKEFKSEEKKSICGISP